MKKPDIPPIKINIISLIKLYRLIKKLIRQLNQKAMCLRKWFSKPEPEVMIPTKKRALLFAINKYGGGNNLNGCINDQQAIKEKLNMFFPSFDVKTYTDSEVTKKRFAAEIDSAIAALRPDDTLLISYSGHGTQLRDDNKDEPDGYDEALYLFDGPFRDDTFNVLLHKIPEGAKVIILLDSCFSGTATREINGFGKKGRFIQTKNYKPGLRSKKRFAKSYDNAKWLTISGCGEHQTSADAFINNKYRGAFTYYALKALYTTMTYEQWFNKIKTYLPSEDFEQAPEMEGNEKLYSKIVFT